MIGHLARPLSFRTLATRLSPCTKSVELVAFHQDLMDPTTNQRLILRM